jgi:hypothetical protein
MSTRRVPDGGFPPFAKEGWADFVGAIPVGRPKILFTTKSQRHKENCGEQE